MLAAYRAAIVRRNTPLPRRVKVVVDCGNGVTSLVAIETLRELGVRRGAAVRRIGRHVPESSPRPDRGREPARPAGRRAAEDAELGIAFDGDGDRIGAVDERGTPVFGDQLLVLFGRDLAQRMGTGIPVIFDVKCSEMLPEQLTRAGLAR